MPALVELSAHEAQEIAQTVLQHELAGHGFGNAEVRSAEDRDGDAALFVTAIIEKGRDLLPSGAVSRAHAALHAAMLAQGDKRFPYLRFRWVGEEPVDDSSAAA